MLILNANLITLGDDPRILPDQAICISPAAKSALSVRREALRAQYPEAEILDARGQYVMPGNICAHTHFYGAYARGMAIPGTGPA